jgi:periplasmic copper chaperone A
MECQTFTAASQACHGGTARSRSMPNAITRITQITHITRRQWLSAGLVLSAPWPASKALACETFTNTLRITHPWTRATPASAPYALLGIRFDEVTQDDQLLAVETPVAQAVVFAPHGGAHAAHGPASHRLPGAPSFAAPDNTRPLPLDLPAGSETILGNAELGASGPHLRLLGLTQDLEVGRSYPMTLTFSKGGTVKVQLSVDYARFT